MIPKWIERLETPRLDEVRDDRFAQFLAIAIVATTLLAAGIEYVRSRDASQANEAAVHAQRTSIQRQAQELLSTEQAQAQVTNFGLSQEQRARAADAFQAQLLPGSSANAQSSRQEQARWERLANLSEAVSQISAAGPNAPGQDSLFPRLLFLDKAVGSDRLFALQDAYNEERANWQKRLSYYAAILTFLAVAVYLFGVALTLKTGIRGLLAVVGIAFVVVGSSWGLLLRLAPPSTPSDRAADEFAAARYGINTAYSRSGDEGWKRADQHYSQAIQLRPTFAQAYHERAYVRFYLGSPQRGVDYLNIAKLDSVRAARADDLKAYDLELRTVGVLLNLGFYTYLEGIQENQSERLKESLFYFRQALKLVNSEPNPGVFQALLYLDEAVAVLAQGHLDQARSLADQFVDHTVYSDVAKKTPRQDPLGEERVLGAALSGLGVLANFRPDLSAQIRGLKDVVVNGVSRPGRPAASTAASVGNLKVDVFPGSLQWTANLKGFDPKSDVISTQWYYQNPLNPTWTVLAQSSGTFEPVIDSGAGPDAYFIESRSLAANGRCLTDGQYRVELYVNGHLLAQKESQAQLGALKAGVLSHLGLSVCYPGDWNQVDYARGFSEGFVSGDKSRGVYVFRYQDLNAAARAQDPTTLSGSLRSATLAAYANRFPGHLTFDGMDSDPYFLDLNGQNVASYTYPGGELVVGAGVTDGHEVLIGLVFAPSMDWDSGRADQLLDAMVLDSGGDQ